MSSRIYGKASEPAAEPPRAEVKPSEASSFATKLVLWGVVVMIVGLLAMCGLGHIPSGG